MKHKNKKYETKAAAGKFEIWKEFEKLKEMEGRKDIEHRTDIDNMRFTVRNDYAFKKLFGRAENIIILREFLSVVLELNKEELKDIVIENPAVGNYYADEKQGILDIKLTLPNGQKVNIEMQNLWEPHYEKRAYFYWASRYLEKFEPGKAYQYLARCVSIHILGERFPLTEELHSIYRVMNVKSFQPFSDDLEFHFLDLTRLKETDSTDLEKWLHFIQTDDRKKPFHYSATISEKEQLDKETDILLEQVCQKQNGKLLHTLIDKATLSQDDIEELLTTLKNKSKTAPTSVACNCLPGQCNCHHHHH